MNKLQQLKKFMIATFDGIHEKEGESPLQIKSKGGSLLDYRIYGNTIQEKSDGINIIKINTVTLEGTEVDISVTGDADLAVTEIYDLAFTTIGCTYTDDTLALFEVTYSDETIISVPPTESFKPLNEDGKTLTKIKCVNKCGCIGTVKNISCYTGRKPYKDTYSEISSVGDRTKNLFSISRDSNHMSNGSVVESGDNYFIGNMNSNAQNLEPGSTNSSSGWIGFQNVTYGTATAANRLVKDLKPNTTYTFSCDIEVLEFFEGITSINPKVLIIANGINYQVWTGAITEINKKYHVKNTFTIGDTIGTVSFILTLNSCKLKFSNPQLEEGSAETDFEPYGYKIPIIIKGKNLLSRISEVTSAGITIKIGINEWTMNGTTEGASSDNLYLNRDMNQSVTLKPGTYTLSRKYISGTYTDITGYALWVGLRNSSNAWVGGQLAFRNSNYNKNVSVTFTLTEEATVSYYMVGNGEFSNYTFQMQLEEGDKSTEFEPYKEPITHTIFLDEPLRSVTGKTDCIDFKNKKVIRNVHEIIVRGTDVVAKSNSYTNYGWNGFEVKLPTTYYFVSPYVTWGLSTYFINPSNQYSHGLTKPYLYVNSAKTTSDWFYFVTIPASSQTLSDFRTWVEERYVENKPVKLIYPRMEAVEKIIELPDINIYKGSVIIEVDTEIKPSNVYIKYKSL